MHLGPSWASWKFWLKVLGLVFLVPYFWSHPPQVDIVWVAAYVALALLVGILFGWIADPIFVRLFPAQRVDPSPYFDRRVAEVKRRPLIEALLLPGEDGFFFVPLLLLGVTPITAAVVSVAYAAIHYPEFPVKHCIAKAVLLYLIATLVLPNGLGSVVVGHLALDAWAYYIWSRGKSSPVTSEADGQ